METLNKIFVGIGFLSFIIVAIVAIFDVWSNNPMCFKIEMTSGIIGTIFIVSTVFTAK